jgi:predicted RNA-binding protein with TRAM domain
MDIPDNLLCLFSANVEERRDSYVVEIPKHEITNGDVRSGETYRTAILASNANTANTANTETEAGTRSASESDGTPDSTPTSETDETEDRDVSKPPVEEGEIREVDIEDIGEQGDGITRVERGFVVIVPETEKGERVTVEITDVQPNVAFGEVKERQTHF